MKRAVLLIVVFIFTQGCGTSNKLTNSPEQVAQLHELVRAKSYVFTATRAYPMPSQAFNAIANSGILPPGTNSGMIDLTTITSFLKIDGDSITGDLPFYGERQFGGGPTSKPGIAFKSVPYEYNQTYNEAKGYYKIVFEISDKTEQYQVNLSLFPNNFANVSINSNQRSTIRYSGTVSRSKALAH